MELREKIADTIEPSLWECSTRADALHLADAILAIPELQEALASQAQINRALSVGDDNRFCLPPSAQPPIASQPK
jgi:hypothetical protein